MGGLMITSDIQLKGPVWRKLIAATVPKIFDTQYKLFVLCVSIGIKKDQRLVFVNDLNEFSTESLHYLPRNIMINKKPELEFLFSTGIVSTFTENYTLDERLQIAFGDEESSYPKIKLLEEFANYGASVLAECVSLNDSTIETMQNLKDEIQVLLEEDYLDDIELEIE